MSSETGASRESGWWESSGLLHILTTFKLAIHPNKLVLALVGIFCTLILGIVLDWIWTSTGNGIRPDALKTYVERYDVRPPPLAEAGIFSVFREHEVHCIRDAIESVRYGRILGSAEQSSTPGFMLPVSIRLGRGVFANLILMGRGVTWMVTYHFIYALLFFVGLLLIWAFFGGAMCRMAAVQHARDESITIKQAARFTWDRLFGGFFMAPLIPLLIILGVGIALVIGGLVLRIPWVGDLVGGFTFFLALLGGFVIALVLVGTVGGGCLFWPTIAVEGSDSFDAISRGFSYLFGRPLRLLWYILLAIVFGSFCWLLVQFVLWLAVASAHLFVDFGSGGKLSTALWVYPTFESLHDIAPAAQKDWASFTGAALIGLWLLPIVGLSWAFLASFFFSGSTIIYYLMRRDVDGTDLGEVFVEEEESGETHAAEPAPAAQSAPKPAPTPASPVTNSQETKPDAAHRNAESPPAPKPTGGEPMRPEGENQGESDEPRSE